MDTEQLPVVLIQIATIPQENKIDNDKKHGLHTQDA
jgi:hypothetical protein